MSIQEIENQIIEEFSVFTDWLDKYEYIIELAYVYFNTKFYASDLACA